jgi:hypothetical protein
MVDGIDINQEDAEKALLPDDLNSLAVGSYIVPNPNRRKYYPVYVLLIVAITYIASLLLPFIDFTVSLIILVLVALMLFVINNEFLISQDEVIEKILNFIDHPIGYYSIALTFLFNLKNILTPVWTTIIYSHESPPKLKTIIEINAYSGEVLGDPYTESINA